MDPAETTNSDMSEEVEADGYYGSDDADTEELDLSFLDEEEEADENIKSDPGK